MSLHCCTIVCCTPASTIRTNICKTDFQTLSRSRLVVYQLSISFCSQASNPLLVWFHKAYNQCTGGLPINTTHSTSVASLTPSPHTLRAQQRLLELSCARAPTYTIYIYTRIFTFATNTQLYTLSLQYIEICRWKIKSKKQIRFCFF